LPLFVAATLNQQLQYLRVAGRELDAFKINHLFTSLFRFGLATGHIGDSLRKALRQTFAAGHSTNTSCVGLHWGAETKAFHVDFRMLVLRWQVPNRSDRSTDAVAEAHDSIRCPQTGSLPQ
jgi:hypothetical protein